MKMLTNEMRKDIFIKLLMMTNVVTNMMMRQMIMKLITMMLMNYNGNDDEQY